MQPKRKGHYAPIFQCAEYAGDEPTAADDDEPRPATGSRTALSSTSTSGTVAVTKVSTRAERPLWKQAAPPELTDEEAQIWNTARVHVDPHCDDEDEDVADPHERAAWLAHLERLVAVAARRRERRRAGRP